SCTDVGTVAASEFGQPPAVDLIGDERGRLARVASWLDASPAETVGLVVLLTGACVAASLFAWTALGRPALPDTFEAHAGQDALAEAGEQAADGGAPGLAGTDAAADVTADPPTREDD